LGKLVPAREAYNRTLRRNEHEPQGQSGNKDTSDVFHLIAVPALAVEQIVAGPPLARHHTGTAVEQRRVGRSVQTNTGRHIERLAQKLVPAEPVPFAGEALAARRNRLLQAAEVAGRATGLALNRRMDRLQPDAERLAVEPPADEQAVETPRLPQGVVRPATVGCIAHPASLLQLAFEPGFAPAEHTALLAGYIVPVLFPAMGEQMVPLPLAAE